MSLEEIRDAERRIARAWTDEQILPYAEYLAFLDENKRGDGRPALAQDDIRRAYKLAAGYLRSYYTTGEMDDGKGVFLA